MEPIRQAILDGVSELVWFLVRNGTTTSEALDDLLDLALRKGVVAMVVPLISHGAQSTRWTPSGVLLADYLAELSSGWNAGWLSEIEFHTYAMAMGENPGPDWPYRPSHRQIDDLRVLSAEFGGWAMWSESGAHYVPIAEWAPIYERWKRAANI